MVAWSGGAVRGQVGVITKGYEETLELVDNFIILMVVMVSLVHMYAKIYQIVHFKYVQFTVLVLNLKKNLKK